MDILGIGERGREARVGARRRHYVGNEAYLRFPTYVMDRDTVQVTKDHFPTRGFHRGRVIAEGKGYILKVW